MATRSMRYRRSSPVNAMDSRGPEVQIVQRRARHAVHASLRPFSCTWWGACQVCPSWGVPPGTRACRRDVRATRATTSLPASPHCVCPAGSLLC